MAYTRYNLWCQPLSKRKRTPPSSLTSAELGFQSFFFSAGPFASQSESVLRGPPVALGGMTTPMNCFLGEGFAELLGLEPLALLEDGVALLLLPAVEGPAFLLAAGLTTVEDSAALDLDLTTGVEGSASSASSESTIQARCEDGDECQL